MKYLAWLLLCAVLYVIARSACAGEGHGIEPWQDANQAQLTVPVPMVSRECIDEMTLFGPAKSCEVLSKYVWVPELSGVLAPEHITALFCLQLKADRLVQCFYRDTAGHTMVVPIKYRGEDV